MIGISVFCGNTKSPIASESFTLDPSSSFAKACLNGLALMGLIRVVIDTSFSVGADERVNRRLLPPTTEFAIGICNCMN